MCERVYYELMCVCANVGYMCAHNILWCGCASVRFISVSVHDCVPLVIWYRHVIPLCLPIPIAYFFLILPEKLLSPINIKRTQQPAGAVPDITHHAPHLGVLLARWPVNLSQQLCSNTFIFQQFWHAWLFWDLISRDDQAEITSLLYNPPSPCSLTLILQQIEFLGKQT